MSQAALRRVAGRSCEGPARDVREQRRDVTLTHGRNRDQAEAMVRQCLEQLSYHS
jgi:hypothetical protein